MTATAADFDLDQHLLASGVTPAQIAAYEAASRAILAASTTAPAAGLSRWEAGFDAGAYFAAHGVTPHDVEAYEAIKANPRAAIEVGRSGLFEMNNVKLKLEVWEDFQGGAGLFTNLWGNSSVAPSTGAVARSAPDFIADSGVMVPAAGEHAGYGYGYYMLAGTFTHNDEPGPYFLLWPSDDKWPGPELDLVEVLPGGQPYGTIHWAADGNAGVGGRGNDAKKSFQYPDLDPRVPHFYWLDWQEGRLTFGVDADVVYTTTENVPRDAAHGGVDLVPSTGVQTWWSDISKQAHEVAANLQGFAYASHVPDAPLV